MNDGSSFVSTRTVTWGLTRLLHRIGRLKVTPRTGWLDRGVPADATESVADHTFRLALLAWLAARTAADGAAAIDPDRVLKLALIHDLAEAVTGDYSPYDPVTVPAPRDPVERRAFLDGRHVRLPARAAAKRAAEAAAMVDLLADLSPALRAELAALWAELDAGETVAARFVKQADKLETFFQSREYLAADPTRPMASFAAEVDDVIDDPVLAEPRDAVRDLFAREEGETGPPSFPIPRGARERR